MNTLINLATVTAAIAVTAAGWMLIDPKTGILCGAALLATYTLLTVSHDA